MHKKANELRLELSPNQQGGRGVCRVLNIPVGGSIGTHSHIGDFHGTGNIGDCELNTLRSFSIRRCVMAADRAGISHPAMQSPKGSLPPTLLIPRRKRGGMGGC